MKDKIIADIGSGTGRSSFELAKFAHVVFGIEPWASMRDFAVQKARTLELKNIAFLNATAEAMPFRPRSIDFIVSIYGFPLWFASAGEVGQHLAQQFVTRALNLLKPGGGLLILGSAPGWRAGELSRVIWPQRVKPEGATRDNQLEI